MSFDARILVEALSHVLLFCLVFGMSATVDVGHLKSQLNNGRAIATGLSLQFVVLPFIGFCVVKSLSLDYPTGLTLLIITTSPGGSYSNWWCSVFNADLALSVTITAISTLLSAVMLPINLFLYARSAYDQQDNNTNVTSNLGWGSVVGALLTVILAIAIGLWASAKYGSDDFKILANRLGNVSGILLVLFSFVVSNTSKDARIWNRETEFYVGVALPCFLGLILGNIVTTALNLWKPERVAVSIECCYQNVGIATSVALSTFRDEDLALAMAVPFFYGCMEAVFLFLYCIGAWKAGWTKAPRNVSLWTALVTTYEVVAIDDDEKVNKADPLEVLEEYYVVDFKDVGSSFPPSELVRA